MWCKRSTELFELKWIWIRHVCCFAVDMYPGVQDQAKWPCVLVCFCCTILSHHFPDHCRLGMSLCGVKRLCQERQGRGVWDMDQLISNGMPGTLGGNQLELIHGHLTQIFLSQSHECSDWRLGELPMFLQFWQISFSSEHGWIEVFSSRRMALVSWIAWLAVYFGGHGLLGHIRSYLVMASDDVIWLYMVHVCSRLQWPE